MLSAIKSNRPTPPPILEELKLTDAMDQYFKQLFLLQKPMFFKIDWRFISNINKALPTNSAFIRSLIAQPTILQVNKSLTAAS